MNLQHDGLIALAIGRNRKETHWKNKEMLWSELATRLSKHHRTAENFQTYLAAKKSRRDEIKDIGGFVGGMLAGGRRKTGSVTLRSIITLDADFASADFWEMFTILCSNAALCYSTHSHSEDKPRLRLIMPLSRELLPDEYEPVARRVADMLGIDQFDDTTYQVERLMYWPSASANGLTVFEYQDGTWINPDEILALYRDWKDSSQWPTSSRHHEIIKREIKKQEDPLEKPGIVGAFCRSYTISEAIDKFLADMYSECDVPGRYTYTPGSTAAGLVVYDEKFAYSHHGTDPIGGKLCNAFDLVRVQLYGDRDEDSSGKGNTLPSYQAMIDLAAKDKEVRKTIGDEKIKDAFSDFEGIVIDDFNSDWMGELEVDRKGNAYKTISNTVLILENAPVFRGFFAYDEFEKTEVAIKDLPWRKIDKFSRRVTAGDESYIRMHLETPWGISGKEKVNDAFAIVTQKNKIHPVKDFLERAKWDGEDRLDSLFIDFLGVEDSEYARAVTRKTLVAAVKRIYEPGCKFDYMLIFSGPQGTKKSSVINKLGKDWVNESFNFSQLHNGGKEANEQIQGFWIIEVPELSGFDRADMNQVKNFVSRNTDNYRVAYGRKTELFPRQCVFIGNSNNHEFLTDVTGNRRYWVLPIMVTAPSKNVDAELTEDYVNQVWAEAVYQYRKGEEIYLTPDLEEVAKSVQGEHTQEHPWKGKIETYLDTLLPQNWEDMDKDQRYQFINYPDGLVKGVQFRDRVCLQELWIEGLQQRVGKMINRVDAGIIADIMNNMDGWQRAKRLRYGPYGLQRSGWIRTENSIEASKRTGKNNGAELPF